MSLKPIIQITLLAATWILTACTAPSTPKYPTGYDRTETHGDIYAPRETIWKHGSPVDKFIKDHKSKNGQAGPKVND